MQSLSVHLNDQWKCYKMAGTIHNIEPPKAHTEREDSVSWYQPLLFNLPLQTYFRSKNFNTFATNPVTFPSAFF